MREIKPRNLYVQRNVSGYGACLRFAVKRNDIAASNPALWVGVAHPSRVWILAVRQSIFSARMASFRSASLNSMPQEKFAKGGTPSTGTRDARAIQNPAHASVMREATLTNYCAAGYHSRECTRFRLSVRREQSRFAFVR